MHMLLLFLVHVRFLSRASFPNQPNNVYNSNIYHFNEAIACQTNMEQLPLLIELLQRADARGNCLQCTRTTAFSLKSCLPSF